MKVKCYSVRLRELEPISDKCYMAISFDGRKDLIPKSQVFGQDYDILKSDAYWISAWILEKKSIQYSTQKTGWWNPDTRRIEPKYNSEIIVEHHVPEEKEPVKIQANSKLLR